jgi:putative membrane protein
MTLAMVAFWGLIIWGAVTLGRGGTHDVERRSPETILGERLARGEIDEEEYRRRLEALRAGATRTRR